MFNLDEIYSVSNFLKLCKNTIEKNVPSCWIQGEISNLSRPSSGHLYFSLKDTSGQIRCTFFRLNQRKIQFTPENGHILLFSAILQKYELNIQLNNFN